MRGKRGSSPEKYNYKQRVKDARERRERITQFYFRLIDLHEGYCPKCKEDSQFHRSNDISVGMVSLRCAGWTCIKCGDGMIRLSKIEHKVKGE